MMQKIFCPPAAAPCPSYSLYYHIPPPPSHSTLSHGIGYCGTLSFRVPSYNTLQHPVLLHLAASCPISRPAVRPTPSHQLRCCQAPSLCVPSLHCCPNGLCLAVLCPLVLVFLARSGDYLHGADTPPRGAKNPPNGDPPPIGVILEHPFIVLFIYRLNGQDSKNLPLT